MRGRRRRGRADEVVADEVDTDEVAADEVAEDEVVADDEATDETAPAPSGTVEYPGSHAALDNDEQPEGYPIKGNADSMLYHVPGSSHYDRTIAEVWFDTEESAEAAGFEKPPSQRTDDESQGTDASAPARSERDSTTGGEADEEGTA